MILLVWHEIIYSIAVAAFIAGLVLTILLLILASTSLASQGADSGDTGGDADADADADIDAEADASVEVDIDADADIEVETEIDTDLESDLDVESDVDGDGGIENSDTESDAGDTEGGEIGDNFDLDGDIDGDDSISMENQTPLSLVASLYMLWFGVIGVVTYSRILDKYLWLGIILIIPIAITKGISILWRRFSRNTAYKVRVGSELIGRPARVKIEISNESGTVSIHAGDLVQQMPAKSLHPYATFYEGETVYICGVEHGIYLVDSNPESIKHMQGAPIRKKEKTISQFHEAAIRPDV